jgi:toxin HigB-1
MNIEYSNEEAETLCRSQRLLQKKYGKEIVKHMAQRISDLKAAKHLAEMINLPGKFEELTGNRKGQFSLRLDQQFRLILEPASGLIPRKPDGGVDLTKVTAVMIVEAVSDHYR